MESVDIEVEIKQKMDVRVDIGLVIDSINELPITRRWNHIANLLNGVKPSDDLTEEQKGIVIKYLTEKLALFNRKEQP